MKNDKLHIGINDYILAIKKADRDLNLDNGFKSKHHVHRNKKAYNRKRDKKIDYN